MEGYDLGDLIAPEVELFFVGPVVLDERLRLEDQRRGSTFSLVEQIRAQVPSLSTWEIQSYLYFAFLDVPDDALSGESRKARKKAECFFRTLEWT